jgi:pimeloyl-ACP methyl ester carboxylesterase
VKEGNVRAADGRTLTYLERGPAGGAPVFYLHGTPGSRLSRHPDADLYERLGVRVITYDRPGYGGSDPDPGRSVASAVEDVRTIAGALGIERFGVIGISGGGPHALACAALLPNLVARVAVLVSPAPIDDPDFDWLEGMSELNVREFRAAMESEEAFAAEVAPFVEALRTDPGAFVDALAAKLPEPDQAVLARPEVREALAASSAEAVRAGTDGWLHDDRAFGAPWGFALEDVVIETRLWHGDLDVLSPRSHSEHVVRRLPNASLEVVPGAGHLLLGPWATALEWLAGPG